MTGKPYQIKKWHAGIVHGLTLLLQFKQNYTSWNFQTKQLFHRQPEHTSGLSRVLNMAVNTSHKAWGGVMMDEK